MPQLRVISVTSGKGGVGKSHLAANVATLAAREGQRVLIIDADMGLSSLDTLLGVKPTKHLGDVLSGAAIDEVLFQVSRNLWLLPAANGQQNLTHLTAEQQQTIVCLWDALSTRFDLIVIDSAPGISRDVLFFASSAQQVLLVVSGEPTSLTDAYVMAKALRERTDLRRIDVIVSNARTEPHAHAIFARLEGVVSPRISVALRFCGYIPEDQNVRRATALRRPLVDIAPHSPASRAYERLTQALLSTEVLAHGGVSIGVERTLTETKKASDAA